MSYLVDTSIIVDYLRANLETVQELQARSSAGLAVSAISVGELYEGVFRARDVLAAQRVLEQFLQGVDVVPVDDAGAKEFGRLRAHLRSRGTPIGDLDLLIATTAITTGLTLLTGDHDFDHVPGLDTVFLR